MCIKSSLYVLKTQPKHVGIADNLFALEILFKKVVRYYTQPSYILTQFCCQY